ncbi:MAG: PEGA domain-containing protein [Acidobacteria bacterium]|nr:PEGA domain-containing protein [Acidobacteriota bacterium]
MDGDVRAVRGAVRRTARSDRPAGAAPDRAAARVRRTADAVERVRGRPAEAGGQRRPEPTVDRERRRGGAPSARRAVPRPPRGSGIGPGGREQRGRDREYRRGREQRGRDREYRSGREPRGRDREYRSGRDHRRGYGRRWNRGQRPGYWYGWNYRGGYGYHRLGPRYRHWYAPYTHVHYPGYRHGHVYGTSFFAPGLSFAVGYGLGASAHWYRDYGYYDPHAYGYYGGYAYNPTDLHTGFLRLKVRPRFAQVFVDGYFVGVVNEFDGVFQRLRLEEGPHQVEVVHPGFETLELDVLIVPGEKVTFEGNLIRLP